MPRDLKDAEGWRFSSLRKMRLCMWYLVDLGAQRLKVRE